MQRWERVVAAAAVVLVAGSTACDRPGEEEDVAAVPGPTEEVEPLEAGIAARLPAGVQISQVEQGRELFAVCAVCHGFDARGTQLGPSLRDGEWIHTDGELARITEVITQGVAEPEEYEIPMPPLGGGDFTEEQVRALAAYVYALRDPSEQP